MTTGEAVGADVANHFSTLGFFSYIAPFGALDFTDPLNAFDCFTRFETMPTGEDAGADVGLPTGEDAGEYVEFPIGAGVGNSIHTYPLEVFPAFSVIDVLSDDAPFVDLSLETTIVFLLPLSIFSEKTRRTFFSLSFSHILTAFNSGSSPPRIMDTSTDSSGRKQLSPEAPTRETMPREGEVTFIFL